MKRTEAAIDAIVDEHDPGALRRSRTAARSREVQFGSPTDEPGMTSMWARLFAADAAVIEQRVSELAASGCAGDPRSPGERRADALTALAAGQDRLACGCGTPDCPGGGRPARPPGNTVVHVVAEADTLTEARPEATPPPNPGPGGGTGPTGETVGSHDVSSTQPDDRAEATAPAGSDARAGVGAPCCAAPPAFVIGGGVLPAPLLAAMVEGATIKPVRHPGDAAPEPRYVPSPPVADFVRCRDLTCRWPGCDKPAYACDIDHTVPYPLGPTHASNLKCLCRFHHLLKTFWSGAGGWRDEQLPDGTIVWTAPTGHTYTTHPGSATLFPALCKPTGTLAPAPKQALSRGDRGVMMPKRRHTRAQNLARRIHAERRLNDAHVAERNKPPPF
jgi:hypothetical protein